MYSLCTIKVSFKKTHSIQAPAVVVVAREGIYDYSWYPMMNSWEPQTCW